jgi:hypothetical protein
MSWPAAIRKIHETFFGHDAGERRKRRVAFVTRCLWWPMWLRDRKQIFYGQRRPGFGGRADERERGLA